MNHGKLFLDTRDAENIRLFNVNVFAQFWLYREFLPDMMNENRGHIVNVASVCGMLGSYKLTDYCASNWAVIDFTESLRIELHMLNPKNKITVTAVCPFQVQTKMFNNVDFGRLQWLGLSLTPEYVASEIADGVLKNKDMINIPKVTVHMVSWLR